MASALGVISEDMRLSGAIGLDGLQTVDSGTAPSTSTGAARSVDNLVELLDSLTAPAAPVCLDAGAVPQQVDGGALLQQQTHTLQLSLDGAQQVMLSQDGGANATAQLVIPVDASQLQGGGTVLLPIIPTLMPDGKIEIRVAGNAFALAAGGQLQQGGASASDVKLDGAQQVVFSFGCADGAEELIEAKSEMDDPSLMAANELLRTIRREKQDAPAVAVKRLWPCEYCDYTNTKRYLLKRHMKSHSEERPHQCHICERKFKTQSALANHVNTHTGTKPFPCRFCPAAFTTSGEMVRHVRYRHTNDKPHKCPECDYSTVELSKLKRHVRSHTGEKPFKCQYCEYASADTYKMKRHLRVHTGEKPYECEVCMARFTQSNSLKAHRAIHNPEQKPTYACEYCPTVCGRKTDLRIHVIKQHTPSRPFPCKKCGRTFHDRYSFKLHVKSHDGQKCFTCPHCNYAAYSQRHLEQHMMVHSDVKPFECSEAGCGRRFRQMSQLRRHHNLRHDPHYTVRQGDKTHTCTRCGRMFQHLGNLRRHEQWHEHADDGDDVEDDADAADEPPPPVLPPPQFAKPLRRLRKPRPVGRPRKVKPEQLGLTNVRRRGRPRKLVRQASSSGAPTSVAARVDAAQRARDLQESFGFAQLGGDADDDDDASLSEEIVVEELIEEVVVDSDTLALTPADAAGFPLPSAGAMRSSGGALPSTATQISMFDIDPDDDDALRDAA